MIIHVDMDAFFAAVEERDFPNLKGKAVAVGGRRENRGVISTANYVARTYGVKSAMATSRAFRLCPHLILQPTRMSVYVDVSRHILQILSQYTSNIEPLSLDEAFLDVSASLKLFGSELEIANSIKKKIQTELNLTASVGIAKNKFLAKLASGFDKPDGLYVIAEGQEQLFLDALPIDKIWGVGPATLQKLQKYQLVTIADMRLYDEHFFVQLLGEYGFTLWKLIHAKDDRRVEPNRQAKSISQEMTFAEDIINNDILAGILAEQIETVCYQLRQKNVYAKTFSVKFRTQDFKRITRDKTLTTATQSTKDFMKPAMDVFLMLRQEINLPLRLVGFGVSNFCEKPTQFDLINLNKNNRNLKLDRVSDYLQNKFGQRVLTSARTLKNTKKDKDKN